MSDDLAEFLLARIDGDMDFWAAVKESKQAHPDRVLRYLADSDAKRRIVARHTPATSYPVGLVQDDGSVTDVAEGSFEAIVRTRQGCPTCAPIYSLNPCDTLKLLAQPYASHPEFRDEWRQP